MQVISGPATTSATPSFVFQPVQLYDYQPLPSQSQCIRLLKLDPDKKHSNGALSGKLEVVDLQSSPRFSALSYVWGEPSNPSPTISCHGCHIDITPNCHDALMALRKLARGVPVWVDAICINQRDTSEKETQIQLMGEIYTCAKTVYIWLGRDDQSGSARKAIACLKLASQLCLCPVGLPWHGDFGWKSVLKDRIKLFVGAYSLRLAICCGKAQRTANRLLKAFKADDLDFLLRRDWLQRIWTFQEVLLASNPVLICGNSRIEWAVLNQSIEFYYDTRLAFDSSLSLGREPWSLRALKRILVTQPTKNPQRLTSAAIQSCTAWRALFRTWMVMPRPSRQKKDGFRALSDAKNHSIVDYQEDMVNLELWLILRMIAAPCLLLLVSVVLGLGIGWEHHKTPYYSSGLGLALAFGFGIGPSVAFFGFVWYLNIKFVHRHSLRGRMYQDMRIRGANALSGIVRAMRERQMSDPKDKSFGLHGILARIFQDNPSKPNYGDSLGRVYRTLFSDFLTWSPSAINFLLDAGPGLEGSPTWVPDWSSVNNRTWVLPEYVFNFLDRIERSGRQQPHVKLKNDTLSVKCSIQGAIEYCSGTIKEAPTDPQHITEHIQTFTQLGIWLLSTRKFFIPRGNHCRSIRQGLWDILPLDPVKQEESSSLPEEPEEIHEFLFSSRRVGTLQKPHIDKTARFLAWYDLVLTDESPLIQREDSDFSYSNEEWVDAVTSFIAANPAIYEFNNATAKILGEQRSLFFAGTNCIGSSTLDVQPGDEIAIIESVRLPMVLRAASSSSLPTYTVVGPAIISGYDGPEYAQDERFTWINLV